MQSDQRQTSPGTLFGNIAVRYTIEHRGVPVGIIEPKTLDDLTAADVQPLPGYEAIRTVVRAGTAALQNLGFLGPAAELASADRGDAALGAAAALGRQLELRDERGEPVAVDCVDLTDWPGAESEVIAFITFRDAQTPVPAPLHPPEPREKNGSRPDA